MAEHCVIRIPRPYLLIITTEHDIDLDVMREDLCLHKYYYTWWRTNVPDSRHPSHTPEQRSVIMQEILTRC